MTDKLLNIESMPSIKLGFTQMQQDDVDHINKYIDAEIWKDLYLEKADQ